MTTTIDATTAAPPAPGPRPAEPAVPDAARPAVDDPSTGRPGRLIGLGLLLAGTAVLYLVGLSASGYANDFYSAAVQAGSESWKAFFYGSLDAGNAITVDKPPASLWLMALSVRMFGLSSWSILVPQALLGVATVGVLYASVRRTSGHTAALVAGALLALTPAAALMFRFNNPDALLVFLMTLASYATLRAAEKASPKWLVGAGVLIGFAFLTKMLQAFLVLPALVLVYLLAARTTPKGELASPTISLGKRVLHLLAAFAAMIVSLGWWVAIVELVPASARPYVGGSTNDSILDLIFGYNGLARILGRGATTGGGGPTGAPAGGGAPGGRGGGFGGPTGITRLFDDVSGGMISWLIPAALILGVVVLLAVRRAPRTSPVRAAVLLWGGWLVVTGLVFSFMAGTYHDYYTVALSPAIAGLVAVAGAALWRRRQTWLARIGLAVAMAATTAWAYVLLGRATGVYSDLRWPVLVVGGFAVVGLLLANRVPRLLASVVLGLAVVGAGTGPAAYALNTVATPHHGSIVTAGPVAASNGPGRTATRGRGAGTQGFGVPQGTLPGPGGPGRFGGGAEGGGTNTALVELLRADGDGYRWAAATTGSQSAAALQLPSEMPVMAIGGFSGGDASPTLTQFQSYVASGQIHYYVSGGNRGGPGGGRGTAAEIASWVADHYAATTVGGATVYDLTQAR